MILAISAGQSPSKLGSSAYSQKKIPSVLSFVLCAPLNAGFAERLNVPHPGSILQEKIKVKSPSNDGLFTLVSQLRSDWKTYLDDLIRLSELLDEEASDA